MEISEEIYQIEQTKKLIQKKCLIVGLFSMKYENIELKINSVKRLIALNNGIVIGNFIQRRGVSRAKKVGGSKKLDKPMNLATFIGKGKAEELAKLSVESNAEIIVFMNKLSEGQKQNLSEMTKCEIIECKILQEINDWKLRKFW